MNSGVLLAYLLVSGIILISGYITYKLLLSRMKMHALNRGVIIAIYALSAITPCALIFTKSSTENTATIMSVNKTDKDMTSGNSDIIIGESEVSSAVTGLSDTSITETAPEKPQPFDVKTAIISVLCAGATIVVFQLFATIAWVITLLRKGNLYKLGHVRIIMLRDTSISPFSWFNLIFISRKDYYADGAMILEHELNHIRRHHSADLAIAELFCIVMWWNPAVWFLKRELNAVHEFQADSDVIASGVSVSDYQMLLVRKAAGARMPLVGSHLNSCKLKQRFKMMREHDASKASRMKAFAVLPMMTIAMMAAGMTEVGNILRSVSVKDVPFLETRSSLRYIQPTVQNKAKDRKEDIKTASDRLSGKADKAETSESAPISNPIQRNSTDPEEYSDEIQWAEIIDTTESETPSDYAEYNSNSTSNTSDSRLSIITTNLVSETHSSNPEEYSDRTQWAEVIKEEIAESQVVYEVVRTPADHRDGRAKNDRHNTTKIRKNVRSQN